MTVPMMCVCSIHLMRTKSRRRILKHRCNQNNTLRISSFVFPKTVLLRGHVRSRVLRLLVSRRPHTRSPPPNPKALCAGNPNRWYGLFYVYISTFSVFLSLSHMTSPQFDFPHFARIQWFDLSYHLAAVYPRWLHIVFPCTVNCSKWLC